MTMLVFHHRLPGHRHDLYVAGCNRKLDNRKDWPAALDRSLPKKNPRRSCLQERMIPDPHERLLNEKRGTIAELKKLKKSAATTERLKSPATRSSIDLFEE